MTEPDYNDLEMVVDDSAVEQTQGDARDEFTILPKGTYTFTVSKVEYSNYQPQPGKTSGITKPCKKITVGLLVDGGEAGKGWCDENLFFYPTCMFKILALFKSVGLISDGHNAPLPWDQLKGSIGDAKFDVETYHSKKFGDERSRMVVKQFLKPGTEAF